MLATQSLDAYFSKYGKLLQQNAQQAMRPLHTPGRDAPVFVDTLRKPFVRQHDVISGAVKALRDNNGIFICGTMGCVAGETEVYDPIAKVMRRVDGIDTDFHVWSYDNGRRVVGKADVPFIKGRRNLYRVRLSNGQSFVCTDHHRLLTESGWLSVREVCVRLAESSLVLQESTSELSTAASPEDAPHCSGTLRDSQSCCLNGRHYDDELPLSQEDTGQGEFPLQACAHEHTRAYSLGDVMGSTAEYSHLYPLSSRLSMQDCPDQHTASLLGESQCHVHEEHSLQTAGAFAVASQSQSGSRRFDTNLSLPEQANPYSSLQLGTMGTGPVYIVEVKFERQDVYYDFTVEKYHNYEVAGVVHHNTGKTLMGQLTVHAHAKGQPYRALVFCPGQLTVKWERELRGTIPGVVVHQLTDWRDVLKLDAKSQPTGPTWYVISRDRAKLGARWQPAIIQRNGKAHCPKCGDVQMKDDVPQELAYFQKEKRACDCGERLWQHNRQIDRWEPAWFIKRKLRGFFKYLILDEVHEEKSAASAQANAAGALISACRYTIALTGTLIGGYAEHLRPLLFRMAPSSVVGEGFTWENSLPFSEKYGRIEKRVTTSSKDCDDGDSNVMSRGRTNRSVMRCVRPGIVPTLLRHIVGNTVFLSLEDVAENLPDLEEQLVPVQMDPQMESDYSRMEKALTAVMKDRFHPAQKKILGPALNAMLNWTDHPHEWDEIGYKDKEGFFHGIVQPTNYPKSLRAFPKEAALIDLVQAERAAGRQVWVYVQLTDKHDVAGRLQTLLQAEGMRVEVMRSTVEPCKREAWITKHAKGADVVISHPKLVETGLDLFDKGGNHNFSTLVFFETGYNLFTMRQAARRSWRIGQHMLCKVFYMYYEDTMQERAMALMGRKLSAAEALEGKFSSDGLAAMVGEDESLELALAKSLAEQATIEAAADAWNRPVIDPVKPVAKPAPAPVAAPVAVAVKPAVPVKEGRNLLIEALKKLQAKQLGKAG